MIQTSQIYRSVPLFSEAVEIVLAEIVIIIRDFANFNVNLY